MRPRKGRGTTRGLATNEVPAFVWTSQSRASARRVPRHGCVGVAEGTLSPILRKEYPVKVILTVGTFSAPEGDELIELEKQEAAEAMRQLLARSLSDVSRAVGHPQRVAAR